MEIRVYYVFVNEVLRGIETISRMQKTTNLINNALICVD